MIRHFHVSFVNICIHAPLVSPSTPFQHLHNHTAEIMVSLSVWSKKNLSYHIKICRSQGKKWHILKGPIPDLLDLLPLIQLTQTEIKKKNKTNGNTRKSFIHMINGSISTFRTSMVLSCFNLIKHPDVCWRYRQKISTSKRVIAKGQHSIFLKDTHSESICKCEHHSLQR